MQHSGVGIFSITQKKQYHRMVLVHHPDKNLGNPSAKDRFLRLKEAYNILSDPDKRKEYDETGKPCLTQAKSGINSTNRVSRVPTSTFGSSSSPYLTRTFYTSRRSTVSVPWSRRI